MRWRGCSPSPVLWRRHASRPAPRGRRRSRTSSPKSGATFTPATPRCTSLPPAIARTSWSGSSAPARTCSARNRRGAEPLHAAAAGMPGSPDWDPQAQAATIARLIAAGADPNASDQGGATPLHKAVRTRCAAAVKALIDGGADPTPQDQGRLDGAAACAGQFRSRRQRIAGGEGGAAGDSAPVRGVWRDPGVARSDRRAERADGAGRWPPGG